MIASSILLPVVSLCLLPIIALGIYVRISRVIRQMGKSVEYFSHKIRHQFFGVLLISPILISLLFVRNFDILTRIAISGTGLIGFYIAVHDILCSRKCGIYEKGLVWNGTWIYFAFVDSWERTDPFTITLFMNDRSIKHLTFPEIKTLNHIEPFLPSG